LLHYGNGSLRAHIMWFDGSLHRGEIIDNNLNYAGRLKAQNVAAHAFDVQMMGLFFKGAARWFWILFMQLMGSKFDFVGTFSFDLPGLLMHVRGSLHLVYSSTVTSSSGSSTDRRQEGLVGRINLLIGSHRSFPCP
jgi:hypothetical protein